jgi:hypothetical protein
MAVGIGLGIVGGTLRRVVVLDVFIVYWATR